MLRWVILVVAVVGLTGAATLVVQYLPDSEDAPKVAVAPVEITGPQPRVEIEGDLIYNFGTMARQDEASHSWIVHNRGDAPLEIWLDGSTTCSCTEAKLGDGKGNKDAKLVIAAGGSDHLDLNWHTKKDLPEDYAQGGTFGTNDPRKPSFKLTVMGKVYPAVVVYPPEMIQISRASNEEPHLAKRAIYSKERPNLKLTKVRTSKPDFIVAEATPMSPEEAKQLKVEKAFFVTVTVKPGMPLGDFHEEVVVETDHPKMPVVKITVAGNLYGPISVTPERVRMTDVVSRKGATRDVTVVVRGDKGTNFRVIKKPEPLDVSIAPDDRSKTKGRYRMTVTVPPGTATGTVSGEIVLQTDHKLATEVRIPVSILISRSAPGGARL